jgi:hypothetical protein
MTSNISPSVPSSSANPAARAAGKDPIRPEAYRHPHAAGQGITKVLRLGRALRPPPDDADLADAVERLGQPLE